MKRTKIPVLLVVLILLCVSSLHVPAAMADDHVDRLQRQVVARQHDLIIQTTSEPDDDSDGDPDTMGGGFGYKKSDNLLGGAASCGDDQDSIWMELLLQFMDLFTIVR